MLFEVTQPRDLWSGILVNIVVSIWGYVDAVKVL